MVRRLRASGAERFHVIYCSSQATSCHQFLQFFFDNRAKSFWRAFGSQIHEQIPIFERICQFIG